jgi:hypothetical protein
MLSDWVSYLNDSYIEAYGPELLVFKLDKKETKIHPIYGEERKSRVYLPPFKMKVVHLDNSFRNVLNLEPYRTVEDKEFTFQVNVQRMVSIHSDLRNKNKAILSVEYNGSGIPKISKLNGQILLVVGGTTQIVDIATNNTLVKVRDKIATFSGWISILTGENDLSRNIPDFEEKNILQTVFNLEIRDSVYSNITDSIENGDVVMSNKYIFYEVMDVRPSGNIGWEYSTFNIVAQRADVEVLGLPQQWTERAKSREYKLRGNMYLEG